MAVNEAQNRILMMGLFVLALGLAAVGTSAREKRASADPGFANFSISQSGSPTDVEQDDLFDFDPVDDASGEAIVSAAYEVESINSGRFKPFLAGDLGSGAEKMIPGRDANSLVR
jgi:hypothetical protein